MFQKRTWVFIILIQLFPTLVIAHRVTIFAWIEGDLIKTQSKFSGGKRVNKGVVRVYDKQGQKLLQGQTNKHGEFSFKIPKKSEMKIVIDAGMGHQAQWILSEDTFVDHPTDTNPTPTSHPDHSEIQVENDLEINMTELEKIIEQTMDRKMIPFTRQLNQFLTSQESPSFSDILAGIGYILGLVGLGTYIHYRNKLNDIKEKTT